MVKPKRWLNQWLNQWFNQWFQWLNQKEIDKFDVNVFGWK